MKAKAAGTKLDKDLSELYTTETTSSMIMQGIDYLEDKGKWSVNILNQGKKIFLGVFDMRLEAITAKYSYLEKKRQGWI